MATVTIIVLLILILCFIVFCPRLIEYKYLIKQEVIIKFFLFLAGRPLCARDFLLATLRTNHEPIANTCPVV